MNKGARENLGYSKSELERLTPLDLKPDLTRDEFLALIEPLRCGSQSIVPFRTFHQRKDGTRYPVAVRVQQISDLGPPVFYASIEDITKRVLVEKELHSAQQRLQRLFAQSPAGIVEADAGGRMTLVNDAWCDMLGFERTELLGRTIFDVTHPDSLSRSQEAVEKLMTGASGIVVEKNYLRKDGHRLAALSNVAALRGEDGTFLGIAAVVSDMSERLKAEEKLRESEARLKKILDGTLSFVGVMHPDGTMLEANAAALEASGLSREDVIGKKLWDCNWSTHDPEVAHRLQEAVQQAAAGRATRYDEVLRVKDDGRMNVDLLLTPYYGQDGSVELVVSSGVDITERVRQETMLRELMREVNHRSKNILSVAQAIARQMPATTPDDFKREFGLRLKSLAACQDILVNNGWQSVPVDELNSGPAELILPICLAVASRLRDLICASRPLRARRLVWRSTN